MNHFLLDQLQVKKLGLGRDDKTPANKRRYTDRWSKVLGQSTTTMTNDYGSTDDDEIDAERMKIALAGESIDIYLVG